MITHVVLFKFRDNRHEELKKTRDVLLALKGKIPQIRSIEVGMDVLRSQRSYDIALIAKFDNLADLNAYQVHPAHKVVVEYINERRESTVVVDYES